MKNWVAGLVGGAQGALAYRIQQDELARKEAEKLEDEARREEALIAAEERAVGREEVRNVRDIEQRKIEKTEDRQAATEAEGLVNAREVGEDIAKEERARGNQIAQERRVVAEAESERKRKLNFDEANAGTLNKIEAERQQAVTEASEAGKLKADILRKEAEDAGKVRSTSKGGMRGTDLSKTVFAGAMSGMPTVEDIEKIEKNVFPERQTALIWLAGEEGNGIETEAYLKTFTGDSGKDKSRRKALQARTTHALAQGQQATVISAAADFRTTDADATKFVAEIKDQTTMVMDRFKGMAIEAKDPETAKKLQLEFAKTDAGSLSQEARLAAFYKSMEERELTDLKTNIGASNPGGAQAIEAAYIGAWRSTYGKLILNLKYQ